jgi:CRP/FNR family transcriptional regulator
MDRQTIQKTNEFFADYPLYRFAKGQILIQADDEPTGVYQLISGQVLEYDISEQGEKVVVNILKPPILFPMTWAMNKTPNQYFFEAATPVQARFAPAEDVVNFLKNDRDAAYDLLGRIYSNINTLRRRLAHIMGGNSQSRVIYELIVACQSLGELQNNGSYILNMHEDDLANQAGLSRETVNRELAKLKKDDLISVDHKHIIVTDLSRLQQKLGTSL